MANEYVTRVTLEVNGAVVEDFKSVTEKPREVRKLLRLMNKIGFSRVLPQHQVDVEYVLPEDDPPFDFEAVKDGTLSIVFLSGRKLTFTGVSLLTMGEMKIDGENAATRTIELGATGRVEE